MHNVCLIYTSNHAGLLQQDQTYNLWHLDDLRFGNLFTDCVIISNDTRIGLHTVTERIVTRRLTQ
jgi:hypothetical protein